MLGERDPQRRLYSAGTMLDPTDVARLGFYGKLASAGQLAPHPPAGSCQLAQPDGDLLLHRQAKGAQPDDFASREDLEDRLLRFQDYYQKIAAPFAWTFTRSDLTRLMAKLAGLPRALRPAA